MHLNLTLKWFIFSVTIDCDYRQSVTEVVCFQFRRLHMWARGLENAYLLDTGDISKALKETQPK